MSRIDQEDCTEDPSLKTFVDIGDFDNHIYDSVNKYEGYLPSLHFIDDPLDDDDGDISGVHSNLSSVSAATKFPKNTETDALFDQYDQRKVRIIFISIVIIHIFFSYRLYQVDMRPLLHRVHF